MELDDLKHLPDVDYEAARKNDIKPVEIAEVSWENFTQSRRVLYVAGVDRKRRKLVCAPRVHVRTGNIASERVQGYLINAMSEYDPVKKLR
jgi:hypothetical protein